MRGSGERIGSEKSPNVEAAERYLAGAELWPAQPEEFLEASENASPPRPAWLGRAGGLWDRLLERIGDLRRRSGGRSKLLSVAERLDLGPKKALLIVVYGERRFLVASGAESVSAIVELGAAARMAHPQIAAAQARGPVRTARKQRTSSSLRRRRR